MSEASESAPNNAAVAAQTASPSPDKMRDRILTHATRLFAERGYGSTAVREIAEAVGCTKPALYYHFGSKEQLFLSALREVTDRLTSLLDDELDDDRGSTEFRLIRGVARFLQHVREHPRAMALLMRADLRPEPDQPTFDFASIRTSHQKRVRELLRQGIARGEIRGDIDVEDAAYGITGMVDLRVQLWLQGERLETDLPERIVTLFMRGVSS